MLGLEQSNQIAAFGAVTLELITLGLLVAYFMRVESVLNPIAAWGLWIGLGVSLIASAVTLFYSDVLGIPPCVLCWWQRVFLYPQVVLFAIALWKKDHSIASYSIPLSIIGFAIGLYNHALQVLPSGTLPCPAQGVSCAQRFVFEFGYITFPMMAVTLFGFLIVLMLIVRNRQR